MDELSQIDLVFCLDLTTSMTPFLDAARLHVGRILDGLRATARADLRVALVGYRDHDASASAVEVRDFTDDFDAVRAALKGLQVGSAPSNTDAAEAVVAGLVACVGELAWRPQPYRVLVLVGDGPPHACGAISEPYPDRFPQSDPAGASLEETAAVLARRWTVVHALGMVPSSIPVHDAVLEHAFRRLAEVTGGEWYPARDASVAMRVVENIAQKVFTDVEVDRQVWTQLAQQWSSEASATMPPPAPASALMELAVPGQGPREVQASVERLQKRGLVK